MIEPKSKKSELSTQKIKTIIKSTENTGNVTREGVFVVARATELFIQYLSKNVHKVANTGTTGSGMIQYNHLSKYVNSVDKLEFLAHIIPQKITVKRYREIMAKKNDGDEENESSSTSSEDDSDDDDNDDVNDTNTNPKDEHTNLKKNAK